MIKYSLTFWGYSSGFLFGVIVYCHWSVILGSGNGIVKRVNEYLMKGFGVWLALFWPAVSNEKLKSCVCRGFKVGI